MTSYTPNLKLLKKDPSTDGNDTFNIETMLNENWDKVDEEVGKKAGVDLSNVLESDLIATLSNVNAARIEMGSYVGTGTYGSDNPNTLTFDFVPKCVIIIGYDVSEARYRMTTECIFINGSNTSRTKRSYGEETSYKNTSIGDIKNVVTWIDKTLLWYEDIEFTQLNISGITYYYIAIG